MSSRAFEDYEPLHKWDKISRACYTGSSLMLGLIGLAIGSAAVAFVGAFLFGVLGTWLTLRLALDSLMRGHV